MDLNFDGITHIVSPAHGKFISDAGVWKNFWRMGAAEITQMGAQSLLALTAIFGENTINKRLGNRKSWMIPDSNITAEVNKISFERENIETNVGDKTKAKSKIDENKEDKVSKADAENNLDTKSIKQKDKTKQVEMNKEKWVPGRFEDINEFAINMDFANKQKSELQKLVLKERLKDSILKNLNVWDKEINSLKKSSYDFKDYRSELKRVLEHTSTEILDSRIINFLNNNADDYKPLKKQ